MSDTWTGDAQDYADRAGVIDLQDRLAKMDRDTDPLAYMVMGRELIKEERRLGFYILAVMHEREVREFTDLHIARMEAAKDAGLTHWQRFVRWMKGH